MTAKVLFFGMDGADHAFMDRMMDDGELPTLSRLKEASRVFNFENDATMGAAQFWTSSLIGAGPGHHGHYFYMQFKQDTYDVVPNHESSLPEIKPFWNALDDDGYRVGVVDWHRLQPHNMKNGFVADNWMGHDPLTDPIFSPPSLAEEAAKYFSGDSAAGGFACKDRSTPEAMREYFDTIMRRIEIKTEFCKDKIDQQDWDLFVACFSEIHDVGHYYYHLEYPDHERYDPEVAAAVKEPMAECYRFLDRALSTLLEAAGQDTQIFTFGGPGMEPLISANSASEEMMRRIDLGVGAPMSGAEAARQSYRSLVPEKLRWKIAPLARMFRKRLTANHEFMRRRFFAIPHNDNAAAIRVNLKGREKHGTVAPGAEYNAVLDEIAEAVYTFKNADTGHPLVDRIVFVQKEYSGPHIHLLPDLYIEWNREGVARNFRKIVSDKFGEIELEDVIRTGDHNPSGFYWTPPDYDGAPITLPEHITEPVVKAVRSPSKPAKKINAGVSELRPA